MNQEYALASGYAEFMERFQNRVIVYPNPANINSSCRFFPDEKAYELNHDDAIAAIKNMCQECFRLQDYVQLL